MGRLKSQKQERFCQLYAKTGNASQSYQNAGYKAGTPGSVRSQASQLLTKSNIKERLREIHEEIDSKAIADIREVQEHLTKIIREESDEEVLMTEGTGDGFSQIVSKRKKPATRDRVKAMEMLVRMQGGFLDKVEVKGAVPIVISGDDNLQD